MIYLFKARKTKMKNTFAKPEPFRKIVRRESETKLCRVTKCLRTMNSKARESPPETGNIATLRDDADLRDSAETLYENTFGQCITATAQI